MASAGKLDRADTLVKLLACDGDSTDAATEVRALAGAYVERPNYNIGRSILCSPKRSPIFCNSPRNDSYDSSATTGAFSNQNLKIWQFTQPRSNGGMAIFVTEKSAD